MGIKAKITFSTVVLAGAAVAGLWWLGRRSLMAKRELAMTAALVRSNAPAEDLLQVTAVPAPLALPAA